MTVQHDHQDAYLTAGCPACIAHVEAERWRTAPLREVTWNIEWSYRDPNGEDWNDDRGDGVVSRTFRVPEGASADDVADHYGDDICVEVIDDLVWDDVVPWGHEHSVEIRRLDVEIGMLDGGQVETTADAGEQGSLL